MDKNQIQFSENERKALKTIRNWFVHKGRNPSIRELTVDMKLGSTRTALLLINKLIAKKMLLRKEDGSLRIINDFEENKFNAKTINLPLVGTISCGAPIFAEENIEAYYPVSTSLAHAGSRHFLLRAQGTSMNLAGINDGDIVLIRQQPNAESGQKVVALIDDEATIKIIKFTPEAIILEPKSKNKKHKPIILSRDFQIQGIVITAFPIETLSSKKSHF